MEARLRRERWFNPRFWGCHRVTDFKEPSELARREQCHDCGEPVLVFYDATVAALLRPYLWICLQCGQKREQRDGWTWRAYTDRPKV